MAAVVSDILQTRLELAGLGGYTSGLESAATALGLLDKKLTAGQRKQIGYGFAAGAAAFALGAGLKTAVLEAGKLEQTKIGLETLLGSPQQAEVMLGRLQDFADKSPFDFQTSAQGAQLLLGMGVAADQVIPTMTALGNAISASGRGTQEFGAALLNVAQISNQGKLTGDELRELAQNGVPVKEILKELGATAQDIGKQGISSEKFIAAMQRAFLNGKFGGAMEKQSKTLFGSLSTLGDGLQRAAAAIGEPLIPAVTAVTRALAFFVDLFNKAPGPLKTVVSIIAVGLTGALAVYSASTFFAVSQTFRLAAAHLAAAAAARSHAAATAQLNVQQGIGKGAGLGALLTRGGIWATLIALGLGTEHEALKGAAGLAPDGPLKDFLNFGVENSPFNFIRRMMGMPTDGTKGGSTDPALDELKKQTDIMAKQLELDEKRLTGAIDRGVVPEVQQRQLLAGSLARAMG